jgi:cytidylate kinase
MAVITISRQFGSGGNEIAEQVGRILGYPLFDKQMIARAAMEEGLTDQEAIDYSEDNYKVKGFLERLFGQTRQISHARVWVVTKEGLNQSEEIPLTEENALQLVQRAIQKACEAGNVIVVGRGGQALLQHCPNVLHVRIETPLEQRIQRIKAQFKLARHPAIDLIDERDEISADYVKRIYGVDWQDPFLYHMFLNTGKLEFDSAARLIVEAARLIDLELQVEKAAS